MNIYIQDLLEDGPAFKDKVIAKLVQYCQSLNPDILKFSIFLNSQQDKDLANSGFL